MSQMKPFCFKCGAELDPDAIHCPECGRLQRSMTVRAVDANAPPPPYSGSSQDQPYQFYPDREAPTQQAEPATQHPDAAPQHPDQHDPYAQRYPEHAWGEEQQTDVYGERTPYGEQGEDRVYAQQDYQQPPRDDEWGSDPSYQHGQTQPGYGQQDPAYGHDPGYGQQEPGYGQQEPGYGQQEPGYGQQEPG